MPEKASAEEFVAPTREVVDLVHIATAAAREAMGHLVWVSWCPGRKNCPGHGSTLLLLDRAAAGFLMPRVPVATHPVQRKFQEDYLSRYQVPKEELMTMSHWDLQLLHVLEIAGDDLGACYWWPPMGSYSTHPSGCDKKFSGPAGRPSTWDEPWTCPGTRRSEDSKNREKWLCAFATKGKPRWRKLVDLDHAEDLVWRSYWHGETKRPEVFGMSGEPSAPDVPVPTASGESSSASSAVFMRTKTQWKAKQSEASSSDAAIGGGVKDVGVRTKPSQRPSPEEPSAPGDADESADAEARPTMTKRSKRELRQYNRYMNMRNWVDDPAEAAPGKHCSATLPSPPGPHHDLACSRLPLASQTS